MRLGQKDIDLIVHRIKGEGMRSPFRLDSFGHMQCACIENLDHTGIANGDVEVLQLRIEEGYVGRTTDLALSEYLAGPGIKR